MSLERTDTQKQRESLYHLSERNLEGKDLLPRIPNNYMISQGYEESLTPRISFSKSIDGSLMGLSANLKGKTFFVHEPKEYEDLQLMTPTKKEVPDAHLTDEIWSLNPTPLKMVRKIRVGESTGDEIPYRYGDGLKASLYRWSWTDDDTWEESEMSLKEGLQALDKQAADITSTMEVGEKHGPMKAHLYEQMVDESSQAGGLAGAAGGAILGVTGSDLLDRLEGKRLAAHQNKVEADALLKQQLAVGALTDPSRLDQYGRLADEAQEAERAFLDSAEVVRARARMTGPLPTFTRRLGAGIVGATALGVGAGETMKRLEHNRLNREEGLGIDEKPVASALAGTAGAVGGGLAGRHFRPVRLFSRTHNGLAGALVGASAGVYGTDLGLAVSGHE